MRTKQNYQILTFHTTTAAMAMEDYCHEQKIPGRRFLRAAGLHGVCCRESMSRKKIELKNQG